MSAGPINMDATEQKRVCLVDSRWGVYIPKRFANDFGEQWDLDPQDIAMLQDPDSEHYLDTWTDIYLFAVYIDEQGREWELEYDDDLFAVRVAE